MPCVRQVAAKSELSAPQSPRLVRKAVRAEGATDRFEGRWEGDGHRIVRQRRGDTTDVMLDYVGYKLADLRAAYNGKVDAANLPAAESEMLKAALEAGLTAYTYLDDTPQ